jgi:succinate dehydrogenase subunit D
METQPIKRPIEPFLWTLFSAGGVVAAFLIPVHLFLWGLAFPLGWMKASSYEATLAFVRHPATRVYLFVLCFLPLFHWAHRFRYTLYDGLQVKHLNELINVLCYGGALAGTAVAGWLLWSIR